MVRHTIVCMYLLGMFGLTVAGCHQGNEATPAETDAPQSSGKEDKPRDAAPAFAGKPSRIPASSKNTAMPHGSSVRGNGQLTPPNPTTGGQAERAEPESGLPQWIREFNSQDSSVSGTLTITIAPEPQVLREPPIGKEFKSYHQRDESYRTRSVQFGQTEKGRWYTGYSLPHYRRAIGRPGQFVSTFWEKADDNGLPVYVESPLGSVEHHWFGNRQEVVLAEAVYFFRHPSQAIKKYSLHWSQRLRTLPNSDFQPPVLLVRRGLKVDPKLPDLRGGPYWGFVLSRCPTPSLVLSELVKRSRNHHYRNRADGPDEIEAVFPKDAFGICGDLKRHTPFSGRAILANAAKVKMTVDARREQLISYEILGQDGSVVERGEFSDLRRTSPTEISQFIPYPGLDTITFPIDIVLAASGLVSREDLPLWFVSPKLDVDHAPSVFLVEKNRKGAVSKIEGWSYEPPPQFNPLDPDPFLTAMLYSLTPQKPRWEVSTYKHADRNFVQPFPDGINPSKDNWRVDVIFGMVQSRISTFINRQTGKEEDLDDLGAEAEHFRQMLDFLRPDAQLKTTDPQRYKQSVRYSVHALVEMGHFTSYLLSSLPVSEGERRYQEDRLRLILNELLVLMPHSRNAFLNSPRIVHQRFQNRFDLDVASLILREPQLWELYGTEILAAGVRARNVCDASGDEVGLTHHANEFVEQLKKVAPFRDEQNARILLEMLNTVHIGKPGSAGHVLHHGILELATLRPSDDNGDQIEGEWRGDGVWTVFKSGNVYRAKNQGNRRWENLRYYGGGNYLGLMGGVPIRLSVSGDHMRALGGSDGSIGYAIHGRLVRVRKR